jgi:hypothetical protein
MTVDIKAFDSGLPAHAHVQIKYISRLDAVPKQCHCWGYFRPFVIFRSTIGAGFGWT